MARGQGHSCRKSCVSQFRSFEGPPNAESAADWDRVLGEFDAWVEATHPELLDDDRHGFVNHAD